MLSEKLAQCTRPFNADDIPDWLRLIDRPDVRPAVVVTDPSKSVVLQLRGDRRLIPGNDFCAGWSLRFPRVMKIRDDKRHDEVLTRQELHVIANKDSTYSCANLIGAAKLVSPSKSDKRKREKKASALGGGQVLSHFTFDASAVREVSKLLGGLEFRVVNGSSLISKREIETKIQEHGGRVIMNEIKGKPTRLIAAEKRGVAFTSTEGKDVIDVQWLLLSIEENRLLPLNHSFLLQISEATRDVWRMSMDEYGDYYAQDTCAREVQQVLRSMASLPPAAVEDSVQSQLHADPNLRIPSLLFGAQRILVWNAVPGREGTSKGIAEQFEPYVDCSPLIGAKLIRYGAVLATSIDDAEVVVVPDDFIDSDGPARRVEPKLINGPAKKLVVSEEWVHACIKAGSLRPLQDFSSRSGLT